jgi:hypothetical protein
MGQLTESTGFSVIESSLISKDHERSWTFRILGCEWPE